MTDATHAVTPSALEAFAREYLTELGASIHEEGDQWHVSLPTHVDVGFSDDRDFQIVLSGEQSESDPSGKALTPQSEFTQQLLDEASDIANLGQITLTEELTNGNYRYPSWITESNVDVVDTSFSPYYDRMGICAFIRVGVETVSEYQTQFLEAVALDVESENRLPGVAEILVEEFYEPKSEPPIEKTADITLSRDKLATAITAGQRAAVKEVRDEIDEVRQSASHSADSEFKEYRQLQDQRITELQNEISSLSDRLKNVADEVDEADSRQQRVEALEKRSELKEEKENLETELEDVLQEKEQGYAKKRREIYERHAIEVNTRPVAVTLVTYERGELNLKLSEGGRTDSILAPYAIGAGVTDDVDCENCSEQLSDENPIRVTVDGIGCQTCW